MIKNTYLPIALLLFCLGGCYDNTQNKSQTDTENKGDTAQKAAPTQSSANPNDIYAYVKLSADISALNAPQKQLLVPLIKAAKIMDNLFWKQAYGDKEKLLGSIKDSNLRQFAKINYGPWDRLNGDKPFIKTFSEKPKGAQFYPADMSKDEFEKWSEPQKEDLYSYIIRDTKNQLQRLPFHQAHQGPLNEAANLLREAANLAQDQGFKDYLLLRADALTSDRYQDSDLAWMDMKTNLIDVVIGPIETYEDQLFGYRAAYEAYVLLKDVEWSNRLSRYAQFLPELQQGLPVTKLYKQETPGTDSDLNAYDVIYYAGHANAGSKTIAINLPNDETVQLQKGTRRLQLKNAMRAKFDKILTPIAQTLIAQDQQKHITFDAFFANTMFHEVAHGLGIKNTINNQGTVRSALKETASAIEEGKADILGLYMITELFEKKEIPEGQLIDNYVTFMASIFRSVRFGASSAHGKANMVRFNFFKDKGAFSRNEQGIYRIDMDKMQNAMTELSQLILTIQGDGDYDQAKQLLDNKGVIDATLSEDLLRLNQAGIPIDIVFDQGLKQLGL